MLGSLKALRYNNLILKHYSVLDFRTRFSIMEDRHGFQDWKPFTIKLMNTLVCVRSHAGKCGNIPYNGDKTQLQLENDR
jgi:hypothetical protein